MPLHFHSALLEPDDEERSYLNEAYDDWLKAREGDSNDAEFEAANELIGALMNFASISHDEDDEDNLG